MRSSTGKCPGRRAGPASGAICPFQLTVGDDSSVEYRQERLEDVSRIGLPLHPFPLPLLPGGSGGCPSGSAPSPYRIGVQRVTGPENPP